MTILILRVVGLTLMTTATVVSCGDRDTGTSDTGSSGASGNSSVGVTNPGNDEGEVTNPGETEMCSSSDFEDLMITFCEAQNPPPPGAGELGASCVDDTQCDSNYCLEPFGMSAFCSELCPEGNECPLEFYCQDTGTMKGAACYQGVCVYGGVDNSDCAMNLLEELDTACHSECAVGRIQGWMDCLAGAGKLCGQAHADQACGIERGLLESCCNGCDGFRW